MDSSSQCLLRIAMQHNALELAKSRLVPNLQHGGKNANYSKVICLHLFLLQIGNKPGHGKLENIVPLAAGCSVIKYVSPAVVQQVRP